MGQIHTIGLMWDQYTPAVEGQITRDIIAMQNMGPQVDLMVVCSDNSADRLLNTLGVKRSAAEALAGLWITYRTKAELLHAPEHATTVIERDLYVDSADTSLDSQPHPGYYMKPQGRIIPPSLNRHKPPPSHYGVTDPMVILLWSSVRRPPKAAKA